MLKSGWAGSDSIQIGLELMIETHNVQVIYKNSPDSITYSI